MSLLDYFYSLGWRIADNRAVIAFCKAMTSLYDAVKSQWIRHPKNRLVHVGVDVIKMIIKSTRLKYFRASSDLLDSFAARSR